MEQVWPLRYFFEGAQISEEKAQWLEDTGQAHINSGASGGRPPQYSYRNIPEGAWALLTTGPGNSWIEKQPGECPDCHRPWKEHLKPVWVRPTELFCTSAPSPAIGAP